MRRDWPAAIQVSSASSVGETVFESWPSSRSDSIGSFNDSGSSLRHTIGSCGFDFGLRRSSSLGGKIRGDRGPSSAAARENSKAQWGTLMRLESSDHQRGSSNLVEKNHNKPSFDSGPSNPGLSGDIDVQAASFRLDASVIDQLLEGATRSVRLEHLEVHSADAKRSLEQEEERKRIEAEQRRLRRQEREARDPHRKVALKVENRRRFDRVAADPIPMRKVNFEGIKGREYHNLVDVRQLQSQCQGGRTEGATVQSLLDLQRQTQRASKMSSSQSAPAIRFGANSKSMTR